MTFECSYLKKKKSINQMFGMIQKNILDSWLNGNTRSRVLPPLDTA